MLDELDLREKSFEDKKLKEESKKNKELDKNAIKQKGVKKITPIFKPKERQWKWMNLTGKQETGSWKVN